MSGHVTVKVGTQQVNLSPYGFNHYAAEYLAVARSVEVGSSFSPVPYYLYCRCLELGLKAFLLLKGFTKNELKRKLSHDLDAIIVKAESLGLSDFLVLSDEEKYEISKANKYYSNKDFEYFNVLNVSQGHSQLPNLRDLDNIGARIIDNLLEACLNA